MVGTLRGVTVGKAGRSSVSTTAGCSAERSGAPARAAEEATTVCFDECSANERLAHPPSVAISDNAERASFAFAAVFVLPTWIPTLVARLFMFLLFMVVVAFRLVTRTSLAGLNAIIGTVVVRLNFD